MDYWRQYLFANYKDFKDRVSVIKSFDKTTYMFLTQVKTNMVITIRPKIPISSQ